MTDVFSKSQRSQVMSRIRGKGNTSTEIKLATLLRRHGITGWRRHASLIGRPDFCWRREKVAVFVDGCFWHGCPKCYQAPSTNKSFWRAKIYNNKNRDKNVNKQLRALGWTVIRIWECRLRKKEKATIRRILTAIS